MSTAKTLHDTAVKNCIQMEQKCLQCVLGLHYSTPFCAVRISLLWVPCCVFAYLEVAVHQLLLLHGLGK